MTGPEAHAEASDAELLRRHTEGDPDAFGEVVRRHRDRLWAVALRTLADREEAADALQDAMVSAFRASSGDAGRAGSAYRGDAAVTTWLHRIVVNACIDRMRRRAARPSTPLPEHEGALPHAPDRIQDRDTAIVVAEAMGTLPDSQRIALVLVDMRGFSVEDAARILGVAPGTVKSRCSRGRARLLPLLADLRHDAARGAPTGRGNLEPTTHVRPGTTGGGDRGGDT